MNILIKDSNYFNKFYNLIKNLEVNNGKKSEGNNFWENRLDPDGDTEIIYVGEVEAQKKKLPYFLRKRNTLRITKRLKNKYLKNNKKVQK